MPQIHPNARTTPVTRAEIARSGEPTGVLARRYGVSTETIRKWRRRGAEDCQDRSPRPRKLPWKATEEERAVVCALRRATNFALDDLTFVVTHFLPHLNRDGVWRILRAEGISRRPPPPSGRPKRGQGSFRDYDSAACASTSSTCPGRGPPTASGASATSTSPSTGARAPSTSPSRTTRRRRAPSPSCARPPPPSPSA